MIRIQVHITEEQEERLARLERLTGKPKAEIIRAGVDLILEGEELRLIEARKRAEILDS